MNIVFFSFLYSIYEKKKKPLSNYHQQSKQTIGIDRHTYKHTHKYHTSINLLWQYKYKSIFFFFFDKYSQHQFHSILFYYL